MTTELPPSAELRGSAAFLAGYRKRPVKLLPMPEPGELPPLQPMFDAPGFQLPPSVSDGEGREGTLLKLAGALRSVGMPQEAIDSACIGYNQTSVHPPLDDQKVLDRARRYQSAHPRTVVVGAQTSTNIAQYRCLWDTHAPPPRTRDFLIGSAGQGFVPLGKASVIGGIGGSMKTAEMVLWALHVAAGVPWDGHQVEPGAALLLSLEDDAEEMQRRLIATALSEFPPSIHALQQRRVRVVAMPGIDGRLTVNMQGVPARTQLVEAVIDEVRALQAEVDVPVKLLVLDHARLCIGGDLNDSEAVTAGMSALTHIAGQTGAAVVLLCHSPKSSVAATKVSEFGMGDILGSGAFVDNARFAAVMTGLSDKELKTFGLDGTTGKAFLAFRVIKSNYSESGRTVYMQKTPVPNWGVAYPKPIQLSAPLKPIAGASATVAQRVCDFIKASPGRFSRTKVRDLAGKDGALQASEREVRSALDQLFADRRIEEKEPNAADIKEWGVRKRDKVLYAI